MNIECTTRNPNLSNAVDQQYCKVTFTVLPALVKVDPVYFPHLEVVGDIGNAVWQIKECLKDWTPTWDLRRDPPLSYSLLITTVMQHSIFLLGVTRDNCKELFSAGEGSCCQASCAVPSTPSRPPSQLCSCAILCEFS